MGGKLFDVNGHRGGKALGSQRVKAQRVSVLILAQGESVLLSGLITGHQWWTVLYGCGGSGKNGNSWF
jgi:hypothetical protein